MCMETILCQNETINLPLKMSANPTGNVKNDSTINIPNQKEKEKENPIILKIGRVYIITNLINDKKYVGITTRTIEERFKEHIRSSNNEKYSFLINKSIKKYGKENFKIELVKELYSITEKELLFVESFYINKYDTLVDGRCGYNLLKYDSGHLIFSNDVRKRMSESHKGEKNYNFGKCYTKEEKIKQSLSHVGKQIGKDNPFFGKTHTKETKELISSIHKGKSTSK